MPTGDSAALPDRSVPPGDRRDRARRRWAGLVIAAVGLAGLHGVARAAADSAVGIDGTPVTAASAPLAIGRAIYLQGIRPSGAPLIGHRADGTPLVGRDAACVNCHRASGLGGIEGQVLIPPITGMALFGPGPVVVRADRLHDAGVWRSPPPRDAESFAGLVRDGRQPGSAALNRLMPRFELADEELGALTAYLRSLSAAHSPGVTETRIHFATVIAPGVDLARRQAFVDTLRAAVNQIDVNLISGQRQKRDLVERREQSRRRWTLEIRELSGPHHTWAAQLDGWQAQQPAFALLSGLGLGDWEPVQAFCERTAVPCWFPSVAIAPRDAEAGRFGLYFSRGIGLEALALARRLVAGPGRVVQFHVNGDAVGDAAALALQDALAAAGQVVVDRLVDPRHGLGGAEIDALREDDRIVLWLPAALLAQLPPLNRPTGAVYLSATLAGHDEPRLAPGWVDRAWLLQRTETQPLRDANLRRFHRWLNSRQLAESDELLQSEVYFAVNFLAATVEGMLNNLYPNYLIERAESTLAMREAMQVQEEVQALQMGGGGRRPGLVASAAPARPAGAAVDFAEQARRGGTTAYPRLSLGPGQRFASKGAYLRRLGGVEAAEWIVP